MAGYSYFLDLGRCQDSCSYLHAASPSWPLMQGTPDCGFDDRGTIAFKIAAPSASPHPPPNLHSKPLGDILPSERNITRIRYSDLRAR